MIRIALTIFSVQPINYVIEDATRAIDTNGFVIAKESILTSGGQIIKSGILHRHL